MIKYLGRKYNVINTTNNKNLVYYNDIKRFVKFNISAWYENKEFCKSMALSKLAISNQIKHLITHKD